MKPVTLDEIAQTPNATAFGTIAASDGLDTLAQVLSAAGLSAQLRESSHRVGGAYLRLEVGSVMISLERTAPAEILLRGDAPTALALAEECGRVSAALRLRGLAHAIEVYDVDDDLWREFAWSR